jgi:hypothetical protein
MAKLSAEQPHFPFSVKPGLNADSEYSNNPLEYSDLLQLHCWSNKKRNNPVRPTILQNTA